MKKATMISMMVLAAIAVSIFACKKQNPVSPASNSECSLTNAQSTNDLHGSRSGGTDMARIRQNGISSKEDFELLWQKQIPPMNKLSAAAQEEFKNALVFNEENNLRGWTSAEMITHEFNFEEYFRFHQLILAANPVFIIDDPNAELPYPYWDFINTARLKNPSIGTANVAAEKGPSYQSGGAITNGGQNKEAKKAWCCKKCAHCSCVNTPTDC